MKFTLNGKQIDMRLFWEKFSEKNKNFDHIQLTYSALMWISGNHCWFCRIWSNRDRISGLKYFGESYGRTKFEAYRLALKHLYE